MSDNSYYDRIVIRAGPNGLSAAITLARAGRSVIVFKVEQTVDGSTRSSELALPNFVLILIAFCTFVLSVIFETPKGNPLAEVSRR